MRNVKIVSTLGPASDDRATIRRLADAGMSVARLNASHGTPAGRRALVADVRSVDEGTDTPLAVMLDLRGPEVRTAETDAPTEFASGTAVEFVEGTTVSPERIGLSHSIAAVEPGDTVLLDDGRIETTVERVDGETVLARVDSGGELGSRSGVTTRGVDLDLELIGPEDEASLRLAAEEGVDLVAASFVRDGDDVYEIADALEQFGAPDTPVIAKIERAAAIDNIDGIVDAANGVMVARGDLGVECPLEDVPIIQKRIIRRCVDAGIPVITATEMLESMIRSRRPTRAEASDVANAVFDGTDAVMLSGETAVGEHPVEAVETMAAIAERIEESGEYADTRDSRVPAADRGVRTDAVARSARYLASDVGASAIVAVSESGYTARKAAKFRPSVPIIAATPNDDVRRQLAVSWGINARYAAYAADADGIIETAVESAVDAGVAASGDTIVVLAGMMSEFPEADVANTLKVHVVAETIATGRAVVAGQVAAPIVRSERGELREISEGSILVLPADFEGEFDGDVSKIAGIVAADSGLTGYPAIVARELGVPMVSGVTVPATTEDGAVVTVDGERGVVYEGDVTGRARRAE
ncbi:MAG: pyruvate kinase [Natronomonas sp.]|uniref:pyruvate kinase n=1 Tax=Natronomonas sp. TaxID=2184060 RepID=UPI0028700DC7|nr:pyruvate kinase [Natronomonas sp.]MDR9431778.1 pyruvate kinase [Natronomonas sp.]